MINTEPFNGRWRGGSLITAHLFPDACVFRQHPSSRWTVRRQGAEECFFPSVPSRGKTVVAFVVSLAFILPILFFRYLSFFFTWKVKICPLSVHFWQHSVITLVMYFSIASKNSSRQDLIPGSTCACAYCCCFIYFILFYPYITH